MAIRCERISLLSNNPDKAAQLVDLGIDILDQDCTGVYLSPSNAGYLAAKATHSAHTLDLPRSALSRTSRDRGAA